MEVIDFYPTSGSLKTIYSNLNHLKKMVLCWWQLSPLAGGLLYYVAHSFLLTGSIFGLDQSHNGDCPCCEIFIKIYRK